MQYVRPKKAHTPYHKPRDGSIKGEAAAIARMYGHVTTHWWRTSADHEAPKYKLKCVGCGCTLDVDTRPAMMSAGWPAREMGYAYPPIDGDMLAPCQAEYHTHYKQSAPKKLSNRQRKKLRWHKNNPK